MDAREFPHLPDDVVKVDVVHICNPCQPWSLAHTVNGKNDEKNIEAAMIIGDWLDKVKPRIVSLENVDGLLNSLKKTKIDLTVRQCFDRIRQQFLSREYAFRCEVVDMVDYGLPQYRKRLIILGAS